MARRKGIAIIDPAKIAELEQAMRSVPAWVKKARRQSATTALTEFRDSDVAQRFEQKPFGKNNFSIRKRWMLAWWRHGDASRKATPFRISGNFREELARRKPEVKISRKGKVSAGFSVFGGVVNLFGKQRGIVEMGRMYDMVSYSYAHKKTGATVSVTRRNGGIGPTRFSSRTYGQEWQITARETASVNKRYAQLVATSMRTLALSQFTKTGKLKKAAMRLLKRGDE